MSFIKLFTDKIITWKQFDINAVQSITPKYKGDETFWYWSISGPYSNNFNLQEIADHVCKEGKYDKSSLQYFILNNVFMFLVPSKEQNKKEEVKEEVKKIIKTNKVYKCEDGKTRILYKQGSIMYVKKKSLKTGKIIFSKVK